MTVKAPTCHPEKQYYAKGFCANCYSAAWKQANPDRTRETRHREYTKNRDRYLAQGKVYYDANADRIRAKSREWGRKFADRRRAMRLLRDYGISDSEFAAMFTAQDGRCAICRRAELLTVDHDHVTKRVRGLLCHHCNRALGHLRDDPETARAAAEYLERDR